jgi:tetratricopeptide (TPR) repeat protein
VIPLLLLLLQATQPPASTPDGVGAMIARADQALHDGHRQQAEALLQDAGTRAGSVRALLELARLQSQDGRHDAAMQTTRAALARAPNAEDALAAFAELSLVVHSAVPAILTLESLTRMCPSEPRYFYLLGVGLMTASDMPAAIDALGTANTLAPDTPLTLAALGLAYNNQKRFTEAQAVLRRALDLNPDTLDILAALAEAEQGAGDTAAAERDSARVLARDGTNATANLVIGMVRIGQERYAEARDALITATTLDPSSPKPEYQLSLAYARLGDQASSDRHRELYQEKLRAMQAAVAALHAAAGGGAK